MTTAEYESIIAQAKRIDPVNYMDIAHDHILTGKPMKGLKFEYLSVVEVDTRAYEDTAKACQKCNEIRSINEFPVQSFKGRIYNENTCCNCRQKYLNEWQSKRLKSDPEFHEKRLQATRDWRSKNKEHIAKYSAEYRASEDRKAKQKAYIKKWREENKEHINRYQNDWNRKKKNTAQ